MIGFDVTKAAAAEHHSGMQRISRRLRAEFAGLLAEPLRLVRWHERRARWAQADGADWQPAPTDWLVTPEFFSEAERPGLRAWLGAPGCRTAAIFADAIPLKLPHVTWPQSVARHPDYLKLLAQFDRVLAISAASRDELAGFWRWSRPPRTPPIVAVPLGADGAGRPRVRNRDLPAGPPTVLMVGIVEPRKNQTLLLAAAEPLWREGLAFEVHVVGRVNPHFGRPVERRMREMETRWPGFHFHGARDDATMAELLERSRLVALPSRAEGNGLPVLEALWAGVPCLCNDLPALAENARDGGCVLVPTGAPERWTSELRALLFDDARIAPLMRAALNRPLPTWRDSAQAVLAALA